MIRKQIKKILICCLIWFVLILGMIGTLMVLGQNEGGLTDANQVTESEKDYFIIDNSKKYGIVRQMEKTGKVWNMFSTANFNLLEGWYTLEDEYYDENLYVLFYRDRNDAGREITEYSVAVLNEDMQITYLSYPFRLPLEEMKVTGFFISDSSIYITAIQGDGLAAYVYAVRTSALNSVSNSASSGADVDEWGKKKTEVAEIAIQGTVEGRTITAAEYREGVLTQRYDNEEAGIFGLDNDIRTLYNSRKEPIRVKMNTSDVNVPGFLLIWFVGCIVIALLFILLPGRIRMVYTSIIFEIALIVSLSIAGVVMVFVNASTAAREFRRFEQQALYSAIEGYEEDDFTSALFYDSDFYNQVKDRLKRHSDSDDGINIINTMIVDKSRVIKVSSDGANQEALEDIYGTEVVEQFRSVVDGGATVGKSYQVRGKNIYVLVIPLRVAGADGYYGITVTERDSLSASGPLDFSSTMILLVVIFLLSSIAAFVFALFQNSDIRELQDALGRMAAGSEEEIQKPKVLGKDMDYMWNSIYEIQKNILNINRIKFLTYEAYYRFAPKNVERILGKNSITEVVSEDAVSLRGSIALISMGKNRNADPAGISRINSLMLHIEETRKEYDGTFVSQSSDLSAMELLFMDNNKTCANFGRSLINRIRALEGKEFPETTVLIHYAPFIYGVAGTAEQSSIYLSAPEVELLSGYTEWLHTLHLNLVLTSNVVLRENVEGELRHIGFIIPDRFDPTNRIELYEMLDAESATIRAAKIRNRERFTEALNLFYAQDFYLARNTFTEILRDVPEDELSKWYLFECERMLNDMSNTEFYGELHK